MIVDRLLKRLYQLTFVLSTAVLAACGGPADTADTSLVSIQLNGAAAQVSGGRMIAKATSDNLLDLNQPWLTWSGQASGVVYDAQRGSLIIPAASDDIPMVVAVKRYELPLIANTEYTLTLQSSDSQMAAILYLFDTSGAIVPVPGVTDSFAMARAGTPLVFTAPDNIAGLYLQVQNRWQAAEQGSLTAQLTYPQDDAPAPGDGLELIDASGPWTDWAGNANGVTYDAANTLLTIATPERNAGNRIGVKRFTTALDAGKTYTLTSKNASSAGVATLIFLFDGSGAIIPFVDSQSGDQHSWMSAVGNQQIQFVAPAGVTSFVIQVQSAWMATEPANLVPSLTTAGDAAACTAELDGIGEPEWLSGNGAVGTSARWSSLSISDDGRWVTFASDSDSLIPDDSNPSRRMRVYLYDAQSGQLEKLLPSNGSDTGDYRTPVISGNGQSIYFLTDDGAALDGQATAANQLDVFRYNRLLAQIQRVTNAPRRTDIGRIVRASTDGERVLFTGSAFVLLADQVRGTEFANANLIEYDATSSEFKPIRLIQRAQSQSVVASADLNYLAYRTLSVPEFINGVFVRNSTASYIYTDRRTNTSAIIADIGNRPTGGTIFEAQYYTQSHTISGNGEYVVFRITGQPFTSGGQDFTGIGFYRWERTTNRIVAVAETNARVSPSWPSIAYPTLSANGDIVAFRETQFRGPTFSTISRTLIYQISTARAVAAGYDTSGYQPAMSADGSWLAALRRNRADELTQGPVRSVIRYNCR